MKRFGILAFFFKKKRQAVENLFFGSTLCILCPLRNAAKKSKKFRAARLKTIRKRPIVLVAAVDWPLRKKAL